MTASEVASEEPTAPKSMRDRPILTVILLFFGGILSIFTLLAAMGFYMGLNQIRVPVTDSRAVQAQAGLLSEEALNEPWNELVKSTPQ